MSPARPCRYTPKASQPRPIVCAELRRQSGENARENVARAAGGHAGIAGRIDERVPVRRCNYGS